VTTAPQTSYRAPTVEEAEIRVSTYDQVSGMLISVLLFMGVLTLLLFALWLSSRLMRIVPAVPVRVLEDVGGGGKGDGTGTSDERDFEEPSTEEMREPTEAPVEQQLGAISSVVSTDVELLDSLEGSSSYGNGEGTGRGDGRGPGPGGPGTSDGIPAWERWEVRLQATSLELYANQLDFFKVELGVAGGGNPNVQYISNVSAAQPTVRTGDPKLEKRLRFTHRSGQLREADRSLVTKAGIDPSNRVVFQFYPPAMYTQLLTLENERMGKRRIIEVARTTFGVRGVAGRWEFYVLSQEYRGGL